MNAKNTHEIGPQSAFLASCVGKCNVSYSSPEKKFQIFNTDSQFSITIKDGLGLFSVTEQDSTEGTNENNRGSHLSSCSDLLQSEELIYDDFFEVENGKATKCDYPDIAERGVAVYNFLLRTLSILYSTRITNLHLAFAISIPNSKNNISKDGNSNMQSKSSLYTCTSKQAVEGYSLTLTDVFSCIIEENSYYPLLKTVPDGCDILAQLAIIFSRYKFDGNKCICFKQVDELRPKAALSSILRYKLSTLFFDCKNFDELYVYIKNIISDINEDNLLQGVGLCPDCYNAYMLYETKRIKANQLLQKYSRDIRISYEGERKQKRMEAMRKSEIRRVKRKSAHGCSSNLSFQERKILLPDNSLMIAAKQSIKPSRKASVPLNNFSRTGPVLFNKKENSNSNQNQSKKNALTSNTGNHTFSSTMPNPVTKMNI